MMQPMMIDLRGNKIQNL